MASSSALQYAPGYVDFTYLVNGTWLIAPNLPGYGADHFAPIVAETAMWYENYTGKALVLDRPIHGKSPETQCRNTLKAGQAKGYGMPKVIFSPSAAGIGGFGAAARDFSNMKWVGVPAVDISWAVWYLAKGISDAGYPVQLGFVVRDDDTNPLTTAFSFGAAVVCSTILTSMCLACFIVNIYKLCLHMKFTSGVTTAKIFFLLDLLANGMRFWYVTVNPFYLSKFAYTWTTMCSATHVAFTIVGTLLLALKWRELMLKTKLHVTLFLATLKWPFFIAGGAILILEATSSALKGHWYNITKITQTSTSILVIICLTIVVLLFVSGIQILMKVSTAVGSKRRVLQLSYTTILILASGLGLLLWVALTTGYLIGIYKIGITSILFVQLLSVFGFIGLFACSFLQNWAMPIPSEFLSRNTTTGGNRSSKTHQTPRMGSSASLAGETESPKRTPKSNDADRTASSNIQRENYDDDEEEEESETTAQLAPEDNSDEEAQTPLRPNAAASTSESDDDHDDDDYHDEEEDSEEEDAEEDEE